MNFSAALSRSSVVTPGRILPAIRSIVLTRIAPAAAILSISAGDFLTIMTASESLFEAQRGEGGTDVVVHLDLVLRAVEPAQQAALLVVALQRLRLLVVGGEPLLDGFGLVVVALDQRPPALVALLVVLGRVELDVVDVAVGALAAAREALDHALVRRRDEQGGGQPAAAALHLLGERVGLADRAREAVEQEAVVALVLDLVEDHRDHELVGHQLALVHVLLGLLAELGAVLDVRAQEVARTDVGQPEVLGQSRGLGALPGPGRAQQDEVQLAHEARKPTSGSLRSCASSAAPRAASSCPGPRR